MYGTGIVAHFLCSGLGNYIGKPLLAQKSADYKKLSKEEATEVLLEISKMLFLRNTTSCNKVELGYVEYDETNDSISVDIQPTKVLEVEGRWDTPVTVRLPI
jgi:20S proteasome alpha/beta subunit